MFDFFKKKRSRQFVSSLPVTTDIHSHILPGIDDGAQDIETALDLVKGIHALGIRKTVATPHVISDLYRNTPQTINTALKLLQQACTNAQIDIEISAAAEYMLDDYFLQLLRAPEPLLTISKNIILTEQSYASSTDNLHQIAFEIITAGYRPIMAHPERYHFYHHNYDAYKRLKDMGFLLQVNLLSLTGYYGKPVTRAAKYIIDNNLADLVGTDLHHKRHLDMLQNENTLNMFSDLLGKTSYNNLDIL
jgi:protein-tyrosine phosphatase